MQKSQENKILNCYCKGKLTWMVDLGWMYRCLPGKPRNVMALWTSHQAHHTDPAWELCLNHSSAA